MIPKWGTMKKQGPNNGGCLTKILREYYDDISGGMLAKRKECLVRAKSRTGKRLLYLALKYFR